MVAVILGQHLGGLRGVGGQAERLQRLAQLARVDVARLVLVEAVEDRRHLRVEQRGGRAAAAGWGVGEDLALRQHDTERGVAYGSSRARAVAPTPVAVRLGLGVYEHKVEVAGGTVEFESESLVALGHHKLHRGVRHAERRHHECLDEVALAGVEGVRSVEPDGSKRRSLHRLGAAAGDVAPDEDGLAAADGLAERAPAGAATAAALKPRHAAVRGEAHGRWRRRRGS